MLQHLLGSASIGMSQVEPLTVVAATKTMSAMENIMLDS